MLGTRVRRKHGASALLFAVLLTRWVPSRAAPNISQLKKLSVVSAWLEK